MRKLIYFTILFSIGFNSTVFGQDQKASQETLTDLTNRVMAEILNFQDFVSLIAEGSSPESIREKGIDNCIKLFAPNARIQEKNKFSGREKNWKVDQYMWAIYSRGERAPVLIDFEVIDELNVDDLEEIPQADGSIVYRGTMSFRQFYCKLKPVDQREEITSSNPNVNCSYSDTTDKEVTVEIKRSMTEKGQFWITLFTDIKVLRVF